MNGVNEKPILKTFYKDREVGIIEFDTPTSCIFTYSDEWIKDGYAISPVIPLTGDTSSKSVVNFLRNLFPEGSAFDVLLQTSNLSKTNLLGILTAIGWDTAGAFTFSKSLIKRKTELRPILQKELAAKLEKGLTDDIARWDGKFRLSVAGVQNKLNVYIDKSGDKYLADGAYASTHILKFASRQFPSIVVNELFCMRLAQASGIDVAEVHHERVENHSMLVVKRFDRRLNEDSVAKRHMVDGCQALDLPPEYKYEQNFGSGKDVAHIRDGVSLQKLIGFAQQCNFPAIVIQKLLGWLAFNLLVGNSDAHGKNVSFYMNENGVTLTPFYDLVSVVFESQKQTDLDTQLAMAVGDNFNINEITAYDLLSFADESGVKFDLLQRRLKKVISSVSSGLEKLDFSKDGLDDVQLKDIEALKALTRERCDYFIEQSKQFKSVIEAAF